MVDNNKLISKFITKITKRILSKMCCSFKIKWEQYDNLFG